MWSFLGFQSSVQDANPVEIQEAGIILNNLLRNSNVIEQGRHWPCNYLPDYLRLHDAPSPDESGVFILKAIPLISKECPITFSSTDYNEFRFTLASEILKLI